jgi:hypothetical protein
MDNEKEIIQLKQVLTEVMTSVGRLTVIVTNLAKEQVEIYKRIISLENRGEGDGK